MIVLRDDDCIKKYGTPKIGVTPNYIKTFVIPDKIKKGIPAFKKYTKVTIHKDMKDMFFGFLENVIDNGLGGLIVEWGGSFNVRGIRGVPGEWSIHSFALAFDINMSTNGLGKEPELDRRIVALAGDWGFDWGGFWKRCDGQHFQMSLKKFQTLA